MRFIFSILPILIILSCTNSHEKEKKQEEKREVANVLPDGHYEDKNEYYNIDVVTANDSAYITITNQRFYHSERIDISTNFKGKVDITSGTIIVSSATHTGKVVYNNQNASMLQIILITPKISITGLRK